MLLKTSSFIFGSMFGAMFCCHTNLPRCASSAANDSEYAIFATNKSGRTTPHCCAAMSNSSLRWFSVLWSVGGFDEVVVVVVAAAAAVLLLLLFLNALGVQDELLLMCLKKTNRFGKFLCSTSSSRTWKWIHPLRCSLAKFGTSGFIICCTQYVYILCMYIYIYTLIDKLDSNRSFK